MKKKPAYIIVETNTGYIDGYWLDYKSAVEQCEGMKREFPKGLFIVAIVAYKAQENIALDAQRASGIKGLDMLEVYYGLSYADPE